jgi:hypothetical protein
MVYCDECREWIHQMRRQKDAPDVLDQRYKQNNWCVLFCPGGEYSTGAKFSWLEIRLGVPQMAFPPGTIFENEKNGKRLTVDRTGLETKT